MNILYNYYKETRENKVLFIFDKPFWFIVNKNIESNVISVIENTSSLKTESDKYIKKLFQKAGLYEINKIIEKDKVGIPVINLTRNCNLSCKHCYADAKHSQQISAIDMNIEELKKVIDEVITIFRGHGTNRIIFTGGEPFLRPDIIEIFQYVYEKKIDILLNTNALLISEYQMKILKKYNANLVVSLDGVKKDTHEYIRGENTFELTLKKIKQLVKHGVSVTLSISLHYGNFIELEKYFELAGELGVKGISINNINVLERADSNGLIPVDSGELNNYLYNMLVTNSKHKKFILTTDFANIGAILIRNVKFSYCGVGKTTLVIDSNGDVYPCYNTMIKEFKMGNVKKNTLNYIWNNSDIVGKFKNLSVDKIKKCSDCIVRYYCGGGCRGETYYRYKNLLAPPHNCERKNIIDFMFMLSEINTDIFKEKIEKYKEMESKMPERR